MERLFFAATAILVVSCSAERWAPGNPPESLGQSRQAFLDPSTSIHEYADMCMCQLGARVENDDGTPGASLRLPKDIHPLTNPDAKEIAVTWNQKRIAWGTSGGVDQFLFDGLPGTADYPETGAGGPFIDPDGPTDNLKCDHPSMVNRAQGGCTPSQRFYQKQVDGIIWTTLFRRSAAPTVGGGPWGPTKPLYFNTVDVQAWDRQTGAVCWFDSLENPNGGKSETNGFSYGPLTRPGGRNRESPDGQRALAFFDTVEKMQEGDPINKGCFNCHGNGPILGSDWLRSNDFTGIVRDDLKPYWHAAGLFEFQEFFSGNSPRCNSCHARWMVKASTTPGSTNQPDDQPVGEEMTSIPINTSGRMSRYRLQVNMAGISHVMPPGVPAATTDAAWDTMFKPSVDALKDCNADPTGCDPEFPVIPDFYSDPDPKPSDGAVKVLPPDPPINFSLTQVVCPADIPHPPDDPVCWRASWSDPDGPDAEWTAPIKYYVQSVVPPDDPTYCTSGAEAVYDNGFPEAIAGSSWRKRYQITAYLAPCDCFNYRVCGVWCDYPEIGIQPVKEKGTSDHIIRQCDGD